MHVATSVSIHRRTLYQELFITTQGCNAYFLSNPFQVIFFQDSDSMW